MCGYGGIGRRAGFRYQSSQGGGGSSPLIRTKVLLKATPGSGGLFHFAEGAATGVPTATGRPKFGVPSEFHVNLCARGARFRPQPWLGSELAWYTIQSSLPSGDWK